VPGVNIEDLYYFEPVRYRCMRCLGLLRRGPFPRGADGHPICPLCNVTYIPTDEYAAYEAGKFLKDMRHQIEYRDVLAQCKKLAGIAEGIRHQYRSPLRGLLQALGSAESFVHFTTYGISHQFIGILRLLSQRIQISGVVSLPQSDNEKATTKAELENYGEEGPLLSVKVVDALRGKDFPHQKVLVIDGLLAFKGSTNLTLSGWRKAAKDLDMAEIVTNTDEIIELNNRYFASVWCDPDAAAIAMEYDYGPDP
jgi:hypothetical protein